MRRDTPVVLPPDCAAVDPAGDQVWFRIDAEAVHRMPETTPGIRGARLVAVQPRPGALCIPGMP